MCFGAFGIASIILNERVGAKTVQTFFQIGKMKRLQKCHNCSFGVTLNKKKQVCFVKQSKPGVFQGLLW